MRTVGKLGRPFHIRVISVYHYDLLFHRELCNVAQVILADHHGVGDIHGAVAVYIGGFFCVSVGVTLPR